jgi:hypothetical protein
VHSLFHDIAGDVTERELTAPVFPGSSLLGFTLWHLPRTQDWAVQTVIRGLPEVIADARWHGRGRLRTPGIGAGFTPEEVAQLASGLVLADVLDYADAVHHTTLDWLSALRDDDLDTIPAMEAHEAAYPEYQRPAFRAEVAGLEGKPVWRFVAGPCVGHTREHLGEVGILKQALRAAHATM